MVVAWLLAFVEQCGSTPNYDIGGSCKNFPNFEILGDLQHIFSHLKIIEF